MRGALQVTCPGCGYSLEIETEDCDEATCPSCGIAHRVDAFDAVNLLERPIKHLGRFELRRIIGMGAFGTVWQACDLNLQRTVAIKVPRRGVFAGNEQEERFLREGKVAAQLRHPGIVTVYEVNRIEGQTAIISEYVQGITLAEWIKQQRPHFSQIAEWAAEIADVLEYSHQMGVVHRDLKPENIILEKVHQKSGEHRKPRWRPRLMDFGMAKWDSKESTLTLEGHILGTPAYMSPEQAISSHDVDARTDIYALGVVLYELLTAELPFRGTPQMIIQQILHNEPDRPRLLNDRIPQDLETIVFKCMEKEREKRYPGAADVAQELRRWLHGNPIQARPIGSPERLIRWCRARPTVAGLAACLFLTLIFGFLTVLWQWQRAEANLREVRLQRKRAEQNFRMARATVDEFFGNAGRKIGDSPGLQPLYRELMEKGLEYYKEFIRETPRDPAMLHDLAEAYHAVANINRDIGSRDNAMSAYEHTIEAYTTLLKLNPEDGATPGRLALVYQDQGTLYFQMGMFAQAKRSYQNASDHYETLDPAKVSLNDRLNGAYLHNSMGSSLMEIGQFDRAFEKFKRARHEYELLSRQYPENAHIRCGLGYTLHNFAFALAKGRMSGEEIKLYEEGIALIEKSIEQERGHIVWDRRLATACYNLSLAWIERGEYGKARQLLDRAHAIQQQLVSQNPVFTRFQEGLGNTCCTRGIVKISMGKAKDGLEDLLQSHAILEKLHHENPSLAVQQALARSCYELANAFKKERQTAAMYLAKSLTLTDAVLKRQPDQFDGWFLKAMILQVKSEMTAGQGDKRGSLDLQKEAVNLFEKVFERTPGHPGNRKRLDESLKKLTHNSLSGP